MSELEQVVTLAGIWQMMKQAFWRWLSRFLKVQPASPEVPPLSIQIHIGDNINVADNRTSLQSPQQIGLTGKAD